MAPDERGVRGRGGDGRRIGASLESVAGPAGGAARARLLGSQGYELLRKEQFAAALEVFRHAAELDPREARWHVGVAMSADALARDDLVEAHAAEAARLAPSNALAHHILSRRAHRAGELARALECSARAVAVAPANLEFVIQRAAVLFAAGDARAARDAIEPFVAAGSTDRWLADMYARLAPAVEEMPAALAFIDAALRSADLPGRPSGKPMLHFAASTLLDKLGRHAEAFEHARLANEMLRQTEIKHDPAVHADWISRKIQYFTRDRIGSLPRATHDSRRPVFILGMPRSGTTLVEQILGRHPAVFAGGELQALRLVTRAFAGAAWAEEPYPQCFDDLSVGRANRAASDYLAKLDALDPAAPHVTDKQPLNFLLLDVIELLFPRARVIHCVRGALDTCLSCYMTNFELANAYKFDLAHLGSYYRDYLRLMEHWKRVLTVPILDVRYEDVVLDTRGQVRRMLEFLELPWEDACLRYYDGGRPARTASVDQVRRPIYTASIGRWKLYEKQLKPLIAALGGAE